MLKNKISIQSGGGNMNGKTILSFLSTTGDRLSSLPQKDGQLIFVYDKKQVILDNHGVRTIYEQIQTLETEEERIRLDKPIESFYFIVETSMLWRYVKNEWIALGISKSELNTKLDSKLDKNQGTENAGKALIIGSDGNIKPGEVQTGGGIELDPTLTQSGKASEAKAVGDKFLQYAVKNTASGTTPLIIEDSAEEPILDFKLFGKSEQLTTSGKNLFDPNINYEDYVWIRNDGEIVDGSNARTSDYIPVKQGKYAFQFDVSNPNQMFVAGYNTEKAFVKIVGIISKGKGTINIDDISIKTIRVSYTRESTRIQLEFSESPTPYEPYTGGKPSPSPEYPQKIKNVGKWNEEKQKYEVDIKVTGKNLFDGKYVIGSLNASNGEIFTEAKDYGVTDFIEVIPKVNYCYNFRYSSGYKICQYDANKKFLTGNMVKTEISTSKTKFMRFQLYLDSDSVLKDNIQIEIGKTSTLYEPYREPQTVTLSLDEPLRGIVDEYGNMTCDEITKDGILRKIQLITLDGSEDWIHNIGVSGYEGYRFYGTNIPNHRNAFNARNSMCNKLIWAKVKQYDGIHHVFHATQFMVQVPEEEFPDVDSVKSWISENPMEVIHVLAEPILEPLPEDFKKALEEVSTYYPTTVISLIDDNSTVALDYVADTKNYVDNKISQVMQKQLETRALILERTV